ncbi:MAG: subclass B1 metallo-beta-lactamase, partial [Bacteroidota bacterium]
NYGIFPCNGLIAVDQGEAMVFDTPTEDSVAAELLDWIENELNCTVKGVVINHFHDDCLGGLEVFHQRGIPSYANATTIEFAKKDSAEIPLYGFKGMLELSVGNIAIHNTFFGEGHSRDNIVSHIPTDSVLFGGCMIKEVGAGKGNLADANLEQWPQTVAKIKAQYPNLQHIVPGHGEVGGMELLEYTIEMFAEGDSRAVGE